MIVLFYFDWFGSAEELKEMDRAIKTALTKTKGGEYKGRYAPDNKKFHFVSIFEVESYEKLLEALMDPKMPPRDYKKLTHGVFEILRGPLKQ